MKKLFIPLMSASILFTSCATIVSHSQWPLEVKSTPSGAGVTIVNRAGKQVFTGQTPSKVDLKSAAGFFRREMYTINFTMDGYPSQQIKVESKVNGWYWGNILIGGVIGFLVLDPATGAMYKLEKESVTADMTVKTAAAAPQLQILNYSDVSEAMKKNLVRIN